MAELVRHQYAKEGCSKRDPSPDGQRIVDKKVPGTDERIGIGLVGPGPQHGTHRQQKQEPRQYHRGEKRPFFIDPLVLFAVIGRNRNHVT